MKLSIQPMRETDLDVVLAIEQEVALVPWTRGHFADSLRAGYSAWVGRGDGAVVGFALWMLAVDEAHLLNIGVRSAYHGRGCGFELLCQVLANARAAGARSIFLEVRPSNDKGIGLYRRMGFAPVGRRKAYYPAALAPPGGVSVEREDALVFRLGLDETSGKNDVTICSAIN